MKNWKEDSSFSGRKRLLSRQFSIIWFTIIFLYYVLLIIFQVDQPLVEDYCTYLPLHVLCWCWCWCCSYLLSLIGEGNLVCFMMDRISSPVVVCLSVCLFTYLDLHLTVTSFDFLTFCCYIDICSPPERSKFLLNAAALPSFVLLN